MFSLKASNAPQLGEEAPKRAATLAQSTVYGVQDIRNLGIFRLSTGCLIATQNRNKLPFRHTDSLYLPAAK